MRYSLKSVLLIVSKGSIICLGKKSFFVEVIGSPIVPIKFFKRLTFPLRPYWLRKGLYPPDVCCPNIVVRYKRWKKKRNCFILIKIRKVKSKNTKFIPHRTDSRCPFHLFGNTTLYEGKFLFCLP